MAIIGLQKGSGKRVRVREKSVKSQGILIWIMRGNPDLISFAEISCSTLQAAHHCFCISLPRNKNLSADWSV